MSAHGMFSSSPLCLQLVFKLPFRSDLIQDCPTKTHKVDDFSTAISGLAKGPGWWQIFFSRCPTFVRLETHDELKSAP
jgi:hypothetical protein